MAFAAPACAQQSQGGDVAFSYAILRDFEIDQTFPTGWLVAVNGNVSRAFGVVGEVGGNYKTIQVLGTDLNLSVHTFLAGVRLRNESRGAVPFAQFLVGAARGSAGLLGESGSVTHFAFQPGGGVDIRITDRFGIRAQGDVRVITGDTTTTEFRFAAGAVVGFGG
jgi:hypothetical protein